MLMPQKKKQSHWARLKKKAPKVPDYTCPIIDEVLVRIEKFQDSEKAITAYQLKLIKKRMEQLRTDNDLLRESGMYWYDVAKAHLKDPQN